MYHLRITALCIVLAATVAGAQAEPRGIYRSDDFQAARKDVRAAARLRAEREAEAKADGWSFRILTIHTAGRRSIIEPTHYGPYGSEGECETARAQKLATWQTDPEHTDFPATRIFQERHWLKEDWHPTTISVTHRVGDASTTTSATHEENLGPTETFLPEHCLANVVIPAKAPPQLEQPPQEPEQNPPPPMKIIPAPGKRGPEISSR